jgi:glutathione peroxidase
MISCRIIRTLITIIFSFYFVFVSTGSAADPKSFYDLRATLLDGREISFADYKGKVVLVVNLALKCGTTPQLKELQELYQEMSEKDLVILGFPSNDFTGVEPSNPKDINDFCKLHYGVSFPLFRPGSVKGKDIQPVYKYLVQNLPESSSGEISFNFEKILVGPDGKVFSRYGSFTGAQSKALRKSIDSLLGR